MAELGANLSPASIPTPLSTSCRQCAYGLPSSGQRMIAERLEDCPLCSLLYTIPPHTPDIPPCKGKPLREKEKFFSSNVKGRERQGELCHAG